MARKRRKNPSRLLSVQDISDLYDFHANTIRAWIHRDGLRAYRKGRGGKLYIREDDLRDFFARYYEP